MKTLAERLKSARIASGLSQAALADRVGISQQSLHRIEIGLRKQPRKIEKIAHCLGVTPEWLQYGSPLHEKNNQTSMSIPPKKTVLKPLFTWEQLRHFKKDGVDYVMPNIHHIIPAGFVEILDQNNTISFAIKVEGDSMLSSRQDVTSFKEGYILFVDLHKKPKSSSYVIAKTLSSDSYLFRQYIIDNGMPYLKPHDPQYPMIKVDHDVDILGVVKRFIGELEED